MATLRKSKGSKINGTGRGVNVSYFLTLPMNTLLVTVFGKSTEELKMLGYDVAIYLEVSEFCTLFIFILQGMNGVASTQVSMRGGRFKDICIGHLIFLIGSVTVMGMVVGL